jgi:hypothetical protein
MAADTSRVIVSSDSTPQFSAHHHDFPELRASGESARDAATNLAVDLEREIEAASDDLHRTPLRRALDDVRAFVASDR